MPIRRSVIMTAAALGAAAFGAGAIAGFVIGNAESFVATTSSLGSTAVAAVQASPGVPHANMPPHGSAAHENAEKPVTGAAAAQAQAAAVKAAGGGTAGAVTTDFTGSGYEVTVTKSDGSQVEIHLDNSFNPVQGHGGETGAGG